MNNIDNIFMNEAIIEAKEALKLDEVPVGCVIVKDNKIISRSHNLKEYLRDPTAHSEILAIKEACRNVNTWRLNECSMYVTLEPCVMCTGAILQSRIKNLYIGTFDPVGGACGSVVNLIKHPSLSKNVNVYWMYNNECSDMLKNFFKSKR